ncbi:MAG TPA: hypothetical protein PKE69_10350 [Pyrinomonadaceae bacterium]|nr:hypothetical protein [Pyrinomonadaceae bacterium]
MPLDSQTAKYLEGLTKVGGLYTLAVASKAGLLNAYYGNIIALYEAQTGGLVAGAGAGSLALTAGVPIITAVGVWVALGSGYYQAREQAKNENTMSGFSQGFVMAILKWKWHNVVSRFQRPYLRINKADEAMNRIRVESYHKGLQSGFLAGSALSDDAKKEYVKKIRSAGNAYAPKQWSENEYEARNQQISYVIDLAATAMKLQIIKPE